MTDTTLGEKATYESCLRSEREAEREIKRYWRRYAPAAKRQCQDQFEAGGYPSYVEMVTCLELASGIMPNQGAELGQAAGILGSAHEGGALLTREPPAGERTDPIKVLGRD